MSQTLVYYTCITYNVHTYTHTCTHTYMYTYTHTERQHPKALVVLQENKLEVFDIQSDPVPLR